MRVADGGDDRRRRRDARRLAHALGAERRHADRAPRSAMATTVGHVEERRQQVVGEAGVADAAVDLDDLLHHRQAEALGDAALDLAEHDSGFSARPTSCAVATCTTFTSPSSGSTSTTARWATNANAVWQLPWPFSSRSSVGRWWCSKVSSNSTPGGGLGDGHPQRAHRVDDVGAVDREPQRIDAVRARRRARTAARAPRGRRRRPRRRSSTSGATPTWSRPSRSWCRSVRARTSSTPSTRAGDLRGDRDEALADLRRWRTSAWPRRRRAGSGPSSSRRSPRSTSGS